MDHALMFVCHPRKYFYLYIFGIVTFILGNEWQNQENRNLKYMVSIKVFLWPIYISLIPPSRHIFYFVPILSKFIPEDSGRKVLLRERGFPSAKADNKKYRASKKREYYIWTLLKTFGVTSKKPVATAAASLHSPKVSPPVITITLTFVAGEIS